MPFFHSANTIPKLGFLFEEGTAEIYAEMRNVTNDIFFLRVANKFEIRNEMLVLRNAISLGHSLTKCPLNFSRDLSNELRSEK